MVSRSRMVVPLLVLLVPLQSLAADGGAVFKSKCVACHGANGSGDTPMGKKLGLRPLGAPEVQQKSDAAILTVVRDGKGKMPAYAGRVADADLQAVVAHIRTFSKK